MKIETVQNTVVNIRNRVEPKYVVCSFVNAKGLHLEFDVTDDGSVKADFQCDEAFEGYPGVLHGGLISSISDGAMGNCIFACGQTAVFGVPPNTVRLSTGIEKIEILLKDLEPTLSKSEIESKSKARIDFVIKPTKKKGSDYTNVRI